MAGYEEDLSSAAPGAAPAPGSAAPAAPARPSSASEPPAKPRRSFFAPRQVWLPTWRGWLLIAAAFALPGAACMVVARNLYAILAITERVPTDTLVVEGWINRDVIPRVEEEFASGHYRFMVLTGATFAENEGPDEYRSYPELTRAILVKRGMDPSVVIAIPSPNVVRDRTYASAVALREGAIQRGLNLSAINLMTVGPHARRSRILYQRALGPGTRVGVIATEVTVYDTRHWWRSSTGFREITDEVIAYLYARVFLLFAS